MNKDIFNFISFIETYSINQICKCLKCNNWYINKENGYICVDCKLRKRKEKQTRLYECSIDGNAK